MGWTGMRVKYHSRPALPASYLAVIRATRSHSPRSHSVNSPIASSCSYSLIDLSRGLGESNRHHAQARLPWRYEPTTLDMKDAYQHLMNASEKCGRLDWALAEVDRLIVKGTSSDRQGLLTALVESRKRQP